MLWYHSVNIRQASENRVTNDTCSNILHKPLFFPAMVAPEVKQNAEANTEITKACAVLGCEDSKNMTDESFFRYLFYFNKI